MTLLNAILQNDTVKVLVLDNQKSVGEWITQPNTIIAILAIVVSLVGLWISGRYNRKTLDHTIKHNKLSVEPLLKFSMLIYHSTNKIQIELENCGLGTAIIKSFKIYYTDKVYNSFKILFKDNSINGNKDTQNYLFDKESFFSSNKKLCLCSYTFNSQNELDSTLLLLRNIKIIIKYETMYREERTFTEEHLVNEEVNK